MLREDWVDGFLSILFLVVSPKILELHLDLVRTGSLKLRSLADIVNYLIGNIIKEVMLSILGCSIKRTNLSVKLLF